MKFVDHDHLRMGAVVTGDPKAEDEAMAKSHWAAGNVNLKGKKVKLLSCRCCAVQDLREKLECRRIERELRDEAA